MRRVVNSSLISHLHSRSFAHRSSRIAAARSGDTVVVVESPQKAVKLQSYLGPRYNVIPSFGHVCDLPKKQAIDVANDFEVSWEVSKKGAKQLKEIMNALKDASKLVLATDPDREGEAISWHVTQSLKDSSDLKHIDIERITFTEISKNAILQSLDAPREIDMNLVDAYLARRVIDYLLGFTLSPVLWRKLPGARSAGRVQSACLRLICERENAISDFVPEEYWKIDGKLCTTDNFTFNASLTRMGGKTVSKQDLSSEDLAQEALLKVNEADLEIVDLISKEFNKKALAPYRTSTLQQDAAHKLGWDAKKTMNIAQQLYDGRNNAPNGGEGSGLITYMRTDGVHISQEGIQQIRQTIEEQYGSHFLPDRSNVYSKKVLNAQEAHEAIRPLDVRLKPNRLPFSISEDERKLYGLIWRRTIASQMTNAEYLRHSIIVQDSNQSMELRASETELLFEGYQVVYKPESSDDEEQELGDSKSILEGFKQLKKGVKICQKEINKHQHFTKAPPRFNDASIVKTLEELGIGRPSTFAFITSVLVTRNYVSKFRRVYNPWPLGQVLNVYLEKYFQQFVDYDFTSEMEEKLDEIAEGKVEWKTITQQFWNSLTPLIKQAYDVQVRDIIDYINSAMLSRIFHPLIEDGGDLEDARKCPSCIDGKLLIKFSRNGPFIGCSNYEKRKCTFSASMDQLQNGLEMDGIVQDFGEVESLKGRIYVKNSNGRSFVELDTTNPKLKRVVPVPTWKYEVNSLTLEKAMKILEPLKDLGVHPETEMPITIEKGRSRSKYLKYGDHRVDLPKEVQQNWTSMDLKTALQIVDHKSPTSRVGRKSSSSKVNRKSSSSASKVDRKSSASKVDRKSSASKVNGKSSSSTVDSKASFSKVNSNTSSSKIDDKTSSSQVKQEIKKPRSAYNFFFKDKRSLLKEQNPSYTNGQAISELALLWKECPEETKIKYEDLAAKDKIRYEHEMKAKL